MPEFSLFSWKVGVARLERGAHAVDFAKTAGGGYVLHCVVSGGEHSAHGFEARVQNRLADRFAL